jgi:8-oxo-dGTP diphosphatase
MVKVSFYEPDFVPDSKLIYSVVAAKYFTKWVYVRHHQRNTFEIPGGHIEENETPYEAAGRELIEETGALDFNLVCVSTYSVTMDSETRFGKLYFAQIIKMGPVPDTSEIAEITFLDHLPEPVTYPEIQPLLFNRVIEYIKANTYLNNNCGFRISDCGL